MNKKLLHKQSLHELRNLENLFEENSRVLSNFKGDIKNGPKNHAARPLGNWESDNAWDLFAPAETQWYSITKGKVTKVYDTGKNTGKIYGTQVSVQGTDGYPNIFYTHLKNVTVDRGDIVEIGTPIGEISEWGQSKNTHVHVGLPYGKHIQDLLTPDYSETLGTPTTSDSKISVDKDPDKLEKFLDDFGISALSDIEIGDKESQKKLLSIIDDIDIIDTEDGFKIFGYSLDDILKKIADLLPVFESEKKKNNLVEHNNNIIQHKKVISEIRKLNDLLCEVEIKDISSLSKYGRKDEPLKSDKYFILHHSVTDKDAEHVVNILNNRKNKKTGKIQPLGIQYVIDKEGKVFRTLPNGSRGAHIFPSDDYASAPKGINNSNSQGVEVIAMNDTYIRPIQAVAALKLVKQLGFSPDQIFGHGTINPGHKSPSEGKTIKNFIDKNYNKDEDDYDFSDFSESEIADLETTIKKDPDKLEKFLDNVGISALTDIIPGGKESQEKLLSMIDDIDIIDTKDGIKIFGYSLDDVLEKIEDLLPIFESQKKKKNLLEDIEKIKSKIIK